MLKELLKEDYDRIKNYDNLYEKALEMVKILFGDRADKGGMPYMEHLLRVSNSVESENQKIIALLHDTIEDLGISSLELKEIGFNSNIVDTVEILSRNKCPKEDYDKYIERIINSLNIDAYVVKLADLEHNMDISRIKNPSVKDYSRIEKRYRPNYVKIQNKLNERKK